MSSNDIRSRNDDTRLVKELPLLKFYPSSGTSNFVAFRDQLAPYAFTKFGLLGEIITKGSVKKIPEVDTSSYDASNDILGLDAERLKREAGERVKQVAKRQEDKIKLHQTIWGNMSVESRSRVSMHPDFKPDGVSHPTRLWRIIKETHSAGGGSTRARIRNSNVREAYRSIRMTRVESITEFHGRFVDALKALHLTGKDGPEEPDSVQADHFINRLDKRRYSGFQSYMEAREEFKEYPDTLAQAYEKAGMWATGAAPSDTSTIPPPVYMNEVESETEDEPVAQPSRWTKTKKSKGAGIKKAVKNPSKFMVKKPKFPCSLCKGDHFTHECEHMNAAKEAVKAKQFQQKKKKKKNAEKVVTYCHHYVASTNSKIPLVAEDVILDSGATVSIFGHKALLSNIRRASNPITINGFGGSKLVKFIAESGSFGTVYYHPDCPTNILSFSDMHAKHFVDFDHSRNQKRIEVKLANGATRVFEFPEKNGLYVCNMREYRTNCCKTSSALVGATVAENEARYTKREVARARLARIYSKRLGYPSDKYFGEMLKRGVLTECPITLHDIERARLIYGKDIAELKGKSKRVKPLQVRIERLPRSLHAEQQLHVDILFIDGEAFLMSVSKPLGLVMVHRLGDEADLKTNRSTNMVRSKLFSQINEYLGYQFKVTDILSDGEGAVSKVSNELASKGIIMNRAGPGQHVPVIENMIRQLKERVRAVLYSLPYTLPASFMKHLVKFITICINVVPSHTRADSVSPREAFTGLKMNCKTDLRVGFGDYVQATIPDPDNTMKERTDGAIALYPAGNSNGGWYFYNLKTKSVFMRNHFTIIPMDSAVIDHMNDLASNQHRKLRKEPRFSYGNDIPVEGPFDDDQEDQDPSEEELSVNEKNLSEDSNSEVQNSDSQDEEDIDRANHRGVLSDNENRGATTGETSDREDAEQQWDELDQDIQSEAKKPVPQQDFSSRKGFLPAANQSEGPEESPDSKADHRYELRQRKRRNYKADHRGWVADQQAWITWTQQQSHFRSIEWVNNITPAKAIRLFGRQAMEAMAKEMLQLHDQGVFQPVKSKKLSFKQLKSIIRSKMFLKEKYLSSGEFDKLKARLVAGGHMQDKTLYSKTSIASPTPTQQSVFSIASVAAAEHRKVVTADIPGAYLNADMEGEEVLVRLNRLEAGILCKYKPEYIKYLQEDGTMVVKLLKALYGLVQSAKLWYECLRTFLVELGFQCNPYDVCIFNKIVSGKQVTICVYVDDLMITSCNEKAIDKLLKQIKKKFGELPIKRGDVHSYIGMTFDFRSKGAVKLTMEGYIKDLLKEYEVTGKAVTPALEDLYQVDNDSRKLSHSRQEIFHSRVAKLLYLAKRAMPELLPTIMFLSTRVSTATEQDWTKLTRALNYINGVEHHGICLNLIFVREKIQITMYADASWKCHADCKGQTGAFISLGTGPTYVRCSKQKIVSKSSAEAELIALSDMTSMVMWMREFFREQGYEVLTAKVYQDNTSCIKLTENGRSNSDRTRHIKMHYFFMKDQIERGEVKLVYVPTHKMIADILTKPLGGELFRKLRADLCNWKFVGDKATSGQR